MKKEKQNPKTRQAKRSRVEKLVIPQKLLAKIGDILEYEYDFSDQDYNGSKAAPMDEVGLKYYLIEEFWDDTSRKPEQIIKLVRFLDSQNISIEKLKFLSA